MPTRFFNLPVPQRRLLMWLFLILLGLGLVLALIPSPDTGEIQLNDKLLHTTAFFAYAALLDMASRKDFWRFQVPILLGYGALIEVLQSFTPWRMFSLLDFVADAVGLMVYWLLFRMILKVKSSA
ncbi:VanZ like family protein [Thiothrix eikelboomii]|uniref:VanZ like family protein n=1 Tax=Thiothrix eikelboomii TaxID=92487 RepID=A0A1T4XEY2_9GAMM|nr:VanZ family protein [Thiothrix eikelboomii]SKA87615.1 VanZ like family protein [Thiothrix eikelboomii]